MINNTDKHSMQGKGMQIDASAVGLHPSELAGLDLTRAPYCVCCDHEVRPSVLAFGGALLDDQQRGSPLRKYFILGCVGRGLDLDLRVRPAAPAVSGNLGFV